MRIRLRDFRLSRAPNLCGLCNPDLTRVAQLANASEERLLFAPEMGDEGPFGTWAEMAFTVSRLAPYLTTPRGVARLQAVNVCEVPVPIQNQFYEYLSFQIGRVPKQFRSERCGRALQVYGRNVVPTFVDLTNKPQFIAAYATDPTDSNKRVMVSGTDNTDTIITTRDGLTLVSGQWITLTQPFGVSPQLFNSITGIQKDVTNGPVQIFQMDPNTGAQVLLLTMEPGEEVAAYRRYYFDELPCSCCPTPLGQVPSTAAPQSLTVTAIAALEHIPLKVDSDYFVIQNLEALINEAQSIYYEGKESTEAKQKSILHHRNAIRLINGELTRMMGKDQPAVSFKPFGSADLRKARVGYIL